MTNSIVPYNNYIFKSYLNIVISLILIHYLTLNGLCVLSLFAKTPIFSPLIQLDLIIVLLSCVNYFILRFAVFVEEIFLEQLLLTDFEVFQLIREFPCNTHFDADISRWGDCLICVQMCMKNENRMSSPFVQLWLRWYGTFQVLWMHICLQINWFGLIFYLLASFNHRLRKRNRVFCLLYWLLLGFDWYCTCVRKINKSGAYEKNKQK